MVFPLYLVSILIRINTVSSYNFYMGNNFPCTTIYKHLCNINIFHLDLCGILYRFVIKYYFTDQFIVYFTIEHHLQQ